MPGRDYQTGERPKELFTGKERDVETGWDYFGARYYDPSIGRWLSVDPQISKYPSFSPYNYCYNNPQTNIDPNGKDGIKIGFGFVGSAGWINIKLGLHLAYDFRSGFKLMGSYGLGGAKYTKGLGGALYASGTYFSGQLKGGRSAYVVGTKATGLAGVASVSLPMEDLEKVNNPLDMSQLNEASENKQVEVGGGIGGGSTIAGGIQVEGTLINMSHPPKENLDLHNQTGQAPADASNVVPSVEVDAIYSNPDGAIMRSLMQSALGIDPNKTPQAMWEKMQNGD